MMQLLVIPLLAAVLGQGDDPAKVMKAMEDKVARAEAVQVTLDCKIDSNKGNGTFKGTLTVAGGNKARADITMEFMGKAETHQMVSDGTKMVVTQAGKVEPPKDAEKHMRPAVTVALAR